MTIKIGSHSVSEIIYHFTFIPKYRRRRLTGTIKERLEGMIKFCAQVNNWTIVEMNIQPDHVHLLIQTNTTESPSEIMQRVKGGTSHKLRELFPSLIEHKWTKSFWAGGYFVGTVGTRDLKQVQNYVKNQQHQSMTQDDETADY